MQILIILVVLIGAFIAYVNMRPDQFKVTRQEKMAAPKEKVFPHVNDLYAWAAWSPWAKLDPNAKNTFEGPKAGVGAITRWNGNSKVGAGVMTITESRPSDYIQIRLDFLKPMKATNIAEFKFQSEGDQTNVTWSMSGKSNFIGKVIGLVFNCEKMVGGQFEQGLAQMKAIVESSR
jgi:Polyketide cyclase / dehydrase and lipid transport